MPLDDLGGWPGLLARLCDGDDLSASEAESVLAEILAGVADPAQIAAFLVALKIKGETAEETTGLARAMVAAAEPLNLPEGTIDIVGTGGSPARRHGTLNVSTMACFVAAGAGATVCKHGNRRASSSSGAFDLLEVLGVDIDQTPTELESQVASRGIGFAYARTFHPAMRFAGPVRAGIGVPTVFNVLGPLSNPGRVRRQVVGAAEAELADRMVEVLKAQGSVHSLVVTGHGHLDEMATTGPTKVVELRDGNISRWELDPTDLGIRLADPADLVGGDPDQNAVILRGILSGEDRGARRDIIVLNAAAGLVVAGVSEDLASGLEAAGESIDSGAAARVLQSISS
ncbi:MAG: anthranilate phosphoribosyltransferase [Acidimicrobiales bacterium]|nr:anthranilate phosphoribosyltransferase [Acidimicrobiales bacterium]